MASYNKFNIFVLDLGLAVHDLSTGGDDLYLYLTNNTPDAENDAVKADLTGITEQNGYAAADALNDYTRVTTTATLTCTTKQWTAAAGSFGPFQYVVLYNENTAVKTDPLIAWWNYGSSITVLDTETFTVTFGASVFTLT